MIEIALVSFLEARSADGQGIVLLKIGQQIMDHSSGAGLRDGMLVEKEAGRQLPGQCDQQLQ